MPGMPLQGKAMFGCYMEEHSPDGGMPQSAAAMLQDNTMDPSIMGGDQSRADIDSLRQGSARYGSARCGSARHGSARDKKEGMPLM